MPLSRPLAPLRIAFVEDEEDLREEIVFSLNELGFDATGYANGREFYAALQERGVDIALIDVGLPGEDGFSIVSHLRASSSMGVVMLTARGMLEERVRGLQQGADAYLVKPVPIKELAAVLQALGRRLPRPAAQGTAEAGAGATGGSVRSATDGAELQQNGWVLQRKGREETRLVLTAPERAVLRCFFGRLGQEVSRDELIAAIAGDDGGQFDPHAPHRRPDQPPAPEDPGGRHPADREVGARRGLRARGLKATIARFRR